MKPVELKVARIGNSRGVRLPAATLERYQVGNALIMEERAEGILLRPPGAAPAKLSWEDTAAAMVADGDEWVAWSASDADGLGDVPWESERLRRAAARGQGYRGRKGSAGS